MIIDQDAGYKILKKFVYLLSYKSHYIKNKYKSENGYKTRFYEHSS